MATKTGGTAFPTPYFPDEIGYMPAKGMTLRDYFAAKAMNGLCGAYFELLKDEQWTGEFRKPVEEAVEICGKLSYYIADAMLTAREQETP